MDNIDMKTIGLQKSVVEKFNTSKCDHFQIKTIMSHGSSIDHFWNMILTDKICEYDIVLILDIDCVPLSPIAIDHYINRAAEGYLVGNIQRTGHLDNGHHVFAAPSAAAIRADKFMDLGRPSAVETPRGDVLEEYTYQAEKVGIPLDSYMPLRYDKDVTRYEWEKNKEPFWRLKDGMPNYGCGTTYGSAELGDLFYHQFQIRMPGNQELFWKKCESILTN